MARHHPKKDVINFYFKNSFNKKAIENFCEYLRINTIHPDPDYSQAVEFLQEQAKQLQLEFYVYEIIPNNPIVYLKWIGLNESLESIVLNSHMDVVPVFPDKWKHPPLSAYIDEQGNIYARGAQDMKCVGSQYLEAIRKIKTKSPLYVPERNIYVLFVPDEEVGGKKGMELLVDTDVFRLMNVGLVMDEGLANPTNSFSAFYGDRVAWWIKVHISGNTGHGSQFIDNSAGVKVHRILTKFMSLREAEELRMKENNLTIGDVTTVNLTGTTGGVQHNVVPSPFTLDFDIRITPTTDLATFKQMLNDWAEEVGGGIEYEFIQYAPSAYLTATDSSNKWWATFKSVCQSRNMEIKPQVFPAGTDSRFVRSKGISAIGFSPMNNTPILLHDHNEFLNVGVFLRGIEFYEDLILALAQN